MAYDESLASRIRKVLTGRPGISEKKMFGGIAFLRFGHMFVGVSGSELMVRVGKPQYADSLSRDHVREMDFTGKPMAGYVFVDEPGLSTDQALAFWVHRAESFAATLPPKARKKPA